MYRITVSTAFSHYNDSCRSLGRKEASLKLNAYAEARLEEYMALSGHVEPLTVDSLDRYVLRSFLLWLRDEKKISASSTQRVYDVLNAVFRFLVDEELLPSSPMGKVEKPKRDPYPITPLSNAQVQSLIDSCDGSTFTGLRNKLVISLMFDTGVRATELCMVDTTDVDVPAHKLLLRHTKTDVPRFTYFNMVVSRLLSRYLVLRDGYPSGRLIVTERGGGVTRHWLKQMLGRVGEKAGVRVHPHLLRHSCAVASIKNGSDISSVMRLLGHSNPRMSLHYMQLADTDVQDIHRQTSPADRLNINKKGGQGKAGSGKR